MEAVAAPRVLNLLADAIGGECVVTGAALAARHTTDWSDAPAAPPIAVLLPRTPTQVATALRLCNDSGWRVCIQGGLTGLVGGANPQPGEIALSLARLNAIEDFDATGGTVVVQAGVTLQDLQSTTRERGWTFPLDLGSRGSCQLGGNAATNAGGNTVIRYGMMRQSILGLEVALADGRLLTMLDRVIKNNAGFDLKQLFIGSEGSLGVITRLSLKLEPARRASRTVLCGVDDFEKSLLLLRRARAELPELTAFELMWQDFFEAGAAAIKRAVPFDHRFPLYILLEAQGDHDKTCLGAVEAFLSAAIADDIVRDAIIAQSIEQASQLWSYREAVSELLSLTKPCAAFDVSVALPLMSRMVEQLREQLTRRYPGRSHLFFGHLGDGNLHLISGPYHKQPDLHAVETLVYECVGEHHGSISAEHGVGLIKKDYLHQTRSAEEVRVMGALKQLFDPKQILNAGRMFEVAG